ncbi:MAG: L,D-transpeptidase family protein [Proteobacteria bacterium]|nr:L,D-transpeptidase family protein [Pseudomonadota bacterium]
MSYTMEARSVYSAMLPSSIVSMPGNGSTVIVVEKSSQTLYLYRSDMEVVLERTLTCSTGKVQGRKQIAGDQKTPEGVYFFVGKYLEKDLAPVYGVMALPTDYPNLLDCVGGRNGSAIWLHGTDRDLKPMDSNGCVALENGQLVGVEKDISLDFTPIIISEKIDFSENNDQAVISEAVDSFLAKWKDSISDGDYHVYLSFYASEYLPHMAWWNDWRSIRDKAKAETGPFSVEIDNRGIYRDGDVLVVIFRLKLNRGDYGHDAGIRKLYISLKSEEYKIIGDTHKVIHSAGASREPDMKKRQPILWAADQILEQERKGRAARVLTEVRQTIDVWLEAWGKGDIEHYGACYAQGFQSGDMDKKAWLDRKRYLSTVYDYITITISEPTLTIEQNQVRADFRQNYKSSGYTASGIKTLVLVKEEQTWKILQEIWKKN